MYLKGQSQEGNKCLCVGKLTIEGTTSIFFGTKRTKESSHDCVADLILKSKVLKDYIMSGPGGESVNTCAKGSMDKCVGCYECNDGPSKKLSKERVHQLDIELEEYMKQRKVEDTSSSSSEEEELPRRRSPPSRSTKTIQRKVVVVSSSDDEEMPPSRRKKAPCSDSSEDSRIDE